MTIKTPVQSLFFGHATWMKKSYPIENDFIHFENDKGKLG